MWAEPWEVCIWMDSRLRNIWFLGRGFDLLFPVGEVNEVRNMRVSTHIYNEKYVLLDFSVPLIFCL